MAKEIERKFLVKNNSWKQKGKAILYCQGYLTTGNTTTVRIRIIHEKAFLTIKGKTVNASRDEFEYEIPLADARDMLNSLATIPCIEKYRSTFTDNGHIWEVDEFIGDNKGLIVAEVELQSESEEVTLPDWVGVEVTGDAKYYNANLAKFPFSLWKKE